MILKKPYAFFIKNFKLFHLIIFILSAILLYRTTLIYDFMREYTKETPNLIGKELTSTLFASWAYVLIALLIIINVIIIVVMIKKDKPYAYYIANIALYASILVVYIASHRVIGNLEKMLVATKTTLAIRDITNLARLLQTISVVFYLVRATGFDIKKFDFVRDLQGLDISEEDSEEIEVSLEFEKNVFIRNLKKTIRNARYYYKENRLVLNIIMVLFISLMSLLIYVETNKYDKIYKENEYFSVKNFNIGVLSSNILTKDYKNEKLTSDDNVLVTVKIGINSETNNQVQLARTVLVINGNQYFHIKDYDNSLMDIGNVYNNQTITKDFKDYVLVYQVPKTEIESPMIFKYIDNTEYKRGNKITNSIDVKLDPVNLDEQKKMTEEYELANEINTEDSKIMDYKITINNYDIEYRYENTYNACVKSNECYDFKEIIKPSATRNQEKVLLKLEGNISYENVLGKINNLYELINYFGSIEYTYNGKEYTEKSDFNQVIPTKTNNKDIFYIEVNKEIKEAENIKLSFNIRNMKYSYVLRGNINE